MDKNAIKKYAVWARRELIERVSQRALVYGITAKDAGNPNAESVNGHLLSQAEKRQRQALIRNIKTKGYEQVMEEVAYTWFNRFAALRFMEVNGYLPSHIRVFTNDAGEFKPQILAEAIHLELDGLDMNKVYELESANKSEELFKYLLIVQCNALNSILPGMFQRIEDYTELLLPDYLLREGSVIEQMVTTIPEKDWTDQVQIIGWLYQYYNTEPKDKVFADLKKNIKITKENIPAATQLFTPDWIVHYMVENSLGRLWLEGHPNDALKSEWKYYLDEAEQEPEVQVQLAAIRKEYAALKPEEIRVIDPCMGSGHILCVLFDVLVRIYEDYGYTAREAAVKIVENNLWGLDIDERAAQLSYFAVMMKARQYDRRFFTRKVQPHVYAIRETNTLNDNYALIKNDFQLSREHQGTLSYLMDTFVDAKEYGSILQLEKRDFLGLKETWNLANGQDSLVTLWAASVAPAVPQLIEQAIALTQQYHVVVTNPPYMSGSSMGNKLSDYVRNYYPDSRTDLFAVFIERCHKMIIKNGYQAMITQHAWMFLSSFETLRNKLYMTETVNMVHLGARAFEEIGGEVVQTTSFVRINANIDNYAGKYVRLVEPNTQKGKEALFFRKTTVFTANQKDFHKIPSSPCAYWISQKLLEAFENAPKVADLGDPKVGLQSGNSEKYFRYWFEVEYSKISFDKNMDFKWFPCVKGGESRKWFGNNTSIIDWSNDGYGIRHEKSAVIRNPGYYFREGLTWTKITSVFALRYFPRNMILSDSSVYVFPHEYKTLLGCLNSKVAPQIISLLNPTLNFVASTVAAIPVLIDDRDKVSTLVEDNISLSKSDWDAFEISWGFREHPFITSARLAAKSGKAITIRHSYEEWQSTAEDRFSTLKTNEEELNRIFINTYGLSDELTPDVEDKDVTVRRADKQREMRSFISYAVGCMFGRYSLDVSGLICAGGAWDDSKYISYHPDNDAIIPICDDEYFEDDIVGRFVKFVEVAFGKETLEENLRFIADAIGGKGSSREVIRTYFINDFYVDHLKVYQKRPIYWLFDSGKKNGFKCLIYIHRYQPDTVARIRTDYVHEQQSRYRTAIANLEQRINGASTSERVKLNKQLAKLQAQAEEIRIYEEKIHHLADQMIKIDLDDGVKHNYAIFKDVLAKIK